MALGSASAAREMTVICQKTDTRYGKKWHAEGSASISGTAFVRDKLYPAESLAQLVSQPEFLAGWPNSLRN